MHHISTTASDIFYASHRLANVTDDNSRPNELFEASKGILSWCGFAGRYHEW